MDKTQLEKLLNDGLSINQIAKEHNKSYTATKYWVNKHGLKSKYDNFKNTANGKQVKRSDFKADFSHLEYSEWNEQQKKSYSYILGFYLGDGCLGHNNKKSKSKTFMITNQASFIKMNKLITQCLQEVFPTKIIKHYYRKNSDCVNIMFNAVSLEELFPSGKGVKHSRKIQLKEWQEEICKQNPKQFVKGLLESDGCRYKCNDYFVYQFSNCSKDIHFILQKFCDILGIEYTFGEKQFKNEKRATIYLTSFYKRESVEILDSFVGEKS